MISGSVGGSSGKVKIEKGEEKKSVYHNCIDIYKEIRQNVQYTDDCGRDFSRQYEVDKSSWSCNMLTLWRTDKLAVPKESPLSGLEWQSK